jgi:threonine dehydrogenase-like Zn-dependent dehydrogenase
MLVLTNSIIPGSCFYCKLGNTARCEVSQAFGSPATAGAQAEYLRVPNADTSMFHVPDDISMDLIILMAANLPTGYMVAANAAAGQPSKGGVCVVIGCGPVCLAKWGEKGQTSDNRL